MICRPSPHQIFGRPNQERQGDRDMSEKRGADRVLVGITDGKRPLDSPRRRWEDNIKISSSRNTMGAVDWIQLAQDRERALVNAVMNLGVHKMLGNFLTSGGPISLSSKTAPLSQQLVS